MQACFSPRPKDRPTAAQAARRLRTLQLSQTKMQRTVVEKFLEAFRGHQGAQEAAVAAAAAAAAVESSGGGRAAT
jgi:hypothetical protein